MIIHHLLLGEPKNQALEGGKAEVWKSKKITALAQGDYLQKADALIRAKSYVVDTLEAALWCFGTTDSLEAALLAAANLGDDCDTVAAITGQLAGCHYGLNAIPAGWLDVLVEKDRIEQLARRVIDLPPDTIVKPQG